MSHKRLLYALLGWAALGPIGALLGFSLGRHLDDHNKHNQLNGNTNDKSYRSPNHNTGTIDDLNIALLVLIAAVMKSDGEVRRTELELVKNFLIHNYSEEQAKELLSILRNLNQSNNIDIRAVCQQIKINTSYDTRYHMFDFLYALSAADGDISQGEINILNKIRIGLSITISDAQSIAQRHTTNTQYNRNTPPQQDATNDYHTLGINSNASDAEVKQAYRRLAMKYHPDKVATLGEDVRQNAEKQFRIINEAYERIRSARGMK